MKTIDHFINERLQLNKQSENYVNSNYKGYDEFILNKSFSSLEELSDALFKFFKSNYKDKITLSEIKHKKAYLNVKPIRLVNNYVKIDFYKNNKLNYQLTIGDYDKYVTLELTTHYKTELTGFVKDQYEYNRNFLRWLNKKRKYKSDMPYRNVLMRFFGLEKEKGIT